MKTRTNQPVTDYDGIVEGLEEQASKNGIKVFEDIKDKDGHQRFIEGDIDVVEQTGVSYSYKKWSLSGTHLMLVICKRIENGTTTAGGFNAEVTLPEWITEKIVPLTQSGLLENKRFTGWNDTSTANTDFSFSLYKDSGKLKLYNSAVTSADNYNIRIVFDLLIDNE